MSKFLLWIGAGSAQSLNFDYSEFSKVILVDPLLNISSLNFSADSEKFKLIEKGVTLSTHKEQPFYIFNNEEFSSFLEPTGLKKIYPSLAIDEITEVDTTTILAILRECNVTGNSNTLVLDIPCLSGDILEELKLKDNIHLFSTIFISAGKKALYKNSKNVQSVTELLNTAFYKHVKECIEDSEISTAQFDFDPKLQKIALFEKEVLDLNAQIKLVANTCQETEREKNDLKILLSNSQKAFSEVQTELQSKFKESEAYSNQVRALNQEKDALKVQVKASEQKAKSLERNTVELQNQLKRQTDGVAQLEKDLESVKVSDEAKRDKIASLELAFQNSNEKATEYEKQVISLKNEKESFEARILKFNEITEGLKANVVELEDLVKRKTDKVAQLQDKLAALDLALVSVNENAETRANEAKALKDAKEKIESKLSETNNKFEELQEHADKLKKQFQTERDKVKQFEEENTSLKTTGEALKNKIATLDSNLKEQHENAERRIVEISTENDRLVSELQNEKAKASEMHGNHANELEEIKIKLKKSEEKQKETYEWFSSRKHQVEVLSVKIEALERENALLASKNETTLAVSELEKKLTTILNKQNDDSIEIANALGKHVTRCHEEQKSNLASQFELRKLPAFEGIPLSFSSYTMDAPNLAELASLISLNSYDVIVEFGSGLSTLTAASVLQEKINDRIKSSQSLLDNTNGKSGIERSLPRHIVSFEQSSDWLEKTSKLLSKVGLEDFVDLYHAPLVSVSNIENAPSNALFYDCSEKLLELKRIFIGRKVNLLLIVDGPELKEESLNSQFYGLPILLNYLPQCDITVFLNNTKLSEENDFLSLWENECRRRNLNVNIELIDTPKGITLFTIQS
jgi:hypothetical protein